MKKIHAFFYKHCFFWTQAHSLLRHREKAGSKFAYMLLKYTSMKNVLLHLFRL